MKEKRRKMRKFEFNAELYNKETKQLESERNGVIYHTDRQNVRKEVQHRFPQRYIRVKKAK